MTDEDQRYVIIRKPDEPDVLILPAAFDSVHVTAPILDEDGKDSGEGKTYQDLGYKIVRYQDGQEWDGADKWREPKQDEGRPTDLGPVPVPDAPQGDAEAPTGRRKASS